jgi:hypothetical protein
LTIGPIEVKAFVEYAPPIQGRNGDTHIKTPPATRRTTLAI